MQGRPAEKISNKEDFFMAEFASKGWASLNTVLGSIGTAGTTGILGNLFGGGNGGCGDNCYVNRYEAKTQQELAAKDSKIALLESTIHTDGKIADVYERLNIKIGALENQLCEQKVYNATQTATMNCIAGQVNALLGLTKLIVPNSSICPAWGNVTVTPATTTATTTAII
jgi:hypothetical protein